MQKGTPNRLQNDIKFDIFFDKFFEGYFWDGEVKGRLNEIAIFLMPIFKCSANFGVKMGPENA